MSAGKSPFTRSERIREFELVYSEVGESAVVHIDRCPPGSILTFSPRIGWIAMYDAEGRIVEEHNTRFVRNIKYVVPTTSEEGS